MLLTSALQNVLAPFLARDRGNQVAEQLGMERVFAGAMLFVPITTVATASFFPTLELLVWGGKWSAVNHGLYFLCIGATYATIATHRKQCPSSAYITRGQINLTQIDDEKNFPSNC